MSSVSSSINKSNTKFISFLEEPIVKYTVLIFITLLIIFIEKIDTSVLEVFDLCIFKIVYALLIAYTACFDPIYAIILTTFLIMAIQELHNRKTKLAISTHKLAETMNTNSNSNTNTNTNTNTNSNMKQTFVSSKINDNNNNNNKTQTSQSVVYESMPDKDILINNKTVYDFINKGSLQKTPDNNDTLVAEYDYYEDPAFKTITNNLQEKNMIGKNEFFVTDDDLVNVQINTQPGVDQNTSMKAFTRNILNIQGLPNGFDPKQNNMGFM
jgi:hypothetical protein